MPSETALKIMELEKQQQELLAKKEKMIAGEDYEKAIQIRALEKEKGKEIAELKKNYAFMEGNRVKITSADIFKTVANISGIPEEKLAQSKSEKIKNIFKILSAQVIGQKEAIEKISSVILRSQSGIENADRPLGSFLFMGPTGVGKTLTAKVLAQEFFSNSDSFIRIDMSELAERHTISSLIGSPAGYVGYGEGGRLTEKVRRNPYSVVLFDEIEKAHPDVSNILLQILEDGILTDAEGIEANFKNTIVILTTNIGTSEFTEASRIGFDSKSKTKKNQPNKFENIKENSLRELKMSLRPEMLDRLDNIVVFNPLGKADIKKIVSLEMEKLKSRLAGQKIKFSTSVKTVDFIAQKSLTAKQGARLVRKNIQEMLENKIAEMIVHDNIRNGKITADIKKGKIVLV
jgi:ATP-dependent Clp protease ATP-binding subunit ClpC